MPDEPVTTPPVVVPATNQPRLFPPVTITLDRERRLRLDFRALRLFEQETGVNPFDDAALWTWPFPPNLVLTMLWVCLLDDDPSLTKEELETLPGMEAGNILYIRDALNRCWGEAFPQADPDAPTNGTNGSAPKASGRRG